MLKLHSHWSYLSECPIMKSTQAGACSSCSRYICQTGVTDAEMHQDNFFPQVGSRGRLPDLYCRFYMSQLVAMCLSTCLPMPYTWHSYQGPVIGVDFVCSWFCGGSVTHLVPGVTPGTQQKKTAAFLVQVRQLVEYVNCGYVIRYWYKYTCYGTK
jgi:hypothetical protein